MKTGGSQRQTERYRRKVLIPLSGTLLVFLVLFLFFGDSFLQKRLDDELDHELAEVEELFPILVGQRTGLMAAALSQITRDRELQSAFLSGDRDRLLPLAEEVFAPLHTEHAITHFYFHTLEQRAFLRVHQPQRFGDPIDRYTMRQAAETGRLQSGIELGPLGTFTLRVVLPWQVRGKLIGYLELGEEIDPILAAMHEVTGAQQLITIRKEFLDRQGWEEGMRMLGRAADWELFPDRVNILNTLSVSPKELAEKFSTLELRAGQSVDLEHGGRNYRGRHLPLRDASDTEVGEFLVLLDITDQIETFRASQLYMTGICLLLGAALSLSAFGVLGRADRQLAQSHNVLRTQIRDTLRAKEGLEEEIVQRRQAEAALERAKGELEERVAERTAQLQEAFDAVRRGKDRLRGVLQSVRDVLFVTDGEGRILTMNQAAESLLATTLTEVGGQEVAAVIADKALLKQIDAAIASRDPAVFDLVLEDGGRRPKIMQIRTSPIVTEAGYEGMVFLGQDVTSDRQLDRLKSEFISTAAHELRTPLTAILGFSELLKEEEGFSAEEKEGFQAVIHERADYLAALLDDLLDVSRIESGRAIDLNLALHTVQELIEPSVNQYRQAAQTHTVLAQLAEPGLELLVDRAKISQVMENLLSNAVKYSPGGGNIRVTGRRDEAGSYLISVEDEGIGMSPEEASRVFEKFFRADATDAAVKGTGLGMTIVKAIIEAHGGRVWLESEWGRGTTVFFTLPLA